MGARQSLAVIGSGISGLGAAWLLSKAHDVTLFEAEHRPGGHSNTVEAPGPAGAVPVDTGFIVYNTASYPNLIALFDHLGVSTAPTDMSFAVSLDNGGYEYAGSSVATLFGQPANALRPSHWRMILDILRFFREAPSLIENANDESMTLAQYLRMMRYSDAFVARHILPMAAAIWSTPSRQVLDFPVASFVRFFANHGLLQVRDRPQWRTVEGGSREYVKRILAATNGTVRLGEPALRITRTPVGTSITTAQGTRKFDGCVIATHADDALALLADPDDAERRLLGAFHYIDNRAVLHRDASLMPRRRGLWSSWNYLGRSAGCDPDLSLTYWMNKLQPLGAASPDYFVTLNPGREIATSHQVAEFAYRHPLFDSAAMVAQRRLWELQGVRRTWFCGSYFGYGFHEDGLQAGLAVAEAIGGVRRPWSVARESGRIHLPPAAVVAARPVLEAAE